MKAKVRIVLFIVMVGVGLVEAFAPVGVKTAWACSCSLKSPSEAFRQSDFVFSGRVAKISGGAKIFEVSDSWKGINTNRVVVHAFSNTNYCGFPFVLGDEYLVYGYEENGRLYTGLCTRTAAMSNKRIKDDLTYLNTWARLTPQFGGNSLDIIWVGIGSFMVALFVIGFILVQRRTKILDSD